MDSASARQVGVTFEALLLASALRPLAGACGALGEYGVGAIARSVAEHDARGFAAVLAGEVRDAEP
ncbi:MAG: hypothetical protein KGN02_06645 [bacterium]|nr:hypothetical protein [bacterium]